MAYTYRKDLYSIHHTIATKSFYFVSILKNQNIFYIQKPISHLPLLLPSIIHHSFRCQPVSVQKHKFTHHVTSHLYGCQQSPQLKLYARCCAEKWSIFFFKNSLIQNITYEFFKEGAKLWKTGDIKPLPPIFIRTLIAAFWISWKKFRVILGLLINKEVQSWNNKFTHLHQKHPEDLDWRTWMDGV